MKEEYKELMKKLEASLSDEQKQELDKTKARIIDSLNSQKMLMNPTTGTVQSDKFWQQEKSEDFNESELIAVKLIDDKWVKVN
jgi:hypothetical protein